MEFFPGAFFCFDLQDGGAFRGAFFQGSEEISQVFPCALGIDFHIGTLVAYVAANMEFIGQTADKGAEAHSLDNAVDFAMKKCHDHSLLNSAFPLIILGFAVNGYQKARISCIIAGYCFLCEF